MTASVAYFGLNKDMSWAYPAMRTLRALVDKDWLAVLGWGGFLGMVVLYMVPCSVVPVDAEFRLLGCSYRNHHLCVGLGCYYRPVIIRVGESRRLLTRTIPSFVEIQHRTGYFTRETANFTWGETVTCIVGKLPENPRPEDTMVEVLVSLIPAMCLAALIITLLVFLKSPNVPYVLGQPVSPDEYEMDSIPNDVYDGGSPEPVDHKEFTIDGPGDDGDDEEDDWEDDGEDDGEDDDPSNGGPAQHLVQRRKTTDA